ncbi:uncharacterized protein BO96DRAFT_338069 [Aspergillus niger CBS 101883]|uniref:uncharacterized protein n=1 Tax=Aspergillus lacticoffeatus (strain CBS 101883) TaxID=1450533 RepID=UPI000D7FF439|nr:uncharacterized protein BO96DRAFT_338069 [Aspergillus niger CBS 101883]PYH56490.1 hypothetical protein BO96DRAFT_338069 [Aspergillus niger CBS 101883]
MIGQAGAGSTGCQAGCAAKKARGERDTFMRVPPEDRRQREGEGEHPMEQFRNQLQQKQFPTNNLPPTKETPADRSSKSCVLLFFAESIAESTGSSYGEINPHPHPLQRPILGAERLDGVWLSPNAPARACRHAAYWCMCHRIMVVVTVNEKKRILRSRSWSRTHCQIPEHEGRRKEISRNAGLPQLRTAREGERTSPTLAASTNEMATGEEGGGAFGPPPKWSKFGQFRGSSRLCGLVVQNPPTPPYTHAHAQLINQPIPAEVDEQRVSYLRLAPVNAVLTSMALGASFPGLGAIGATSFQSPSPSLYSLWSSVILGGGWIMMLSSRMTWTFFSPVHSDRMLLYYHVVLVKKGLYVSTRKKPYRRFHGVTRQAKTRAGVQDLRLP